MSTALPRWVRKHTSQKPQGVNVVSVSHCVLTQGPRGKSIPPAAPTPGGARATGICMCRDSTAVTAAQLTDLLLLQQKEEKLCSSQDRLKTYGKFKPSSSPLTTNLEESLLVQSHDLSPLQDVQKMMLRDLMSTGQV